MISFQTHLYPKLFLSHLGQLWQYESLPKQTLIYLLDIHAFVAKYFSIYCAFSKRTRIF